MKLEQVKKLKIIELFAGIGAFRRAIEELSDEKVELLFISEISKQTEEAYKAIFPDHKVENLGDIRNINKENLISYKDKCDFLFLGSPCQDFSIAGLNKGGAKWGGGWSTHIDQV